MPAAADSLSRVWSTPSGFAGWLSAVNHRAIGMRYMVTSLVFFLIAGIEGLVIRVQLAAPDLEVLGPGAYNQFFTMHGTTMMFLFVVPFLEGLAIYVVPLMIGARDMAFPRLNAFGYWVYFFSGAVLHWSFFTGTAPHSGWFNYVPLTGPGFSPHVNIDYWVTMITFLEIAALVAAVELVVTIFMQRAPGMSLNRMPLFVWSVLVTGFMIIFAMPPLVVASLMLGLDRLAGMHFFNPAAGGDPLLWQHLFWFFGHPDVYIMLLPALGVVATIVPAAARRPAAGYPLLVLSFVAIGFVSFGLWVHHMYATALPLVGMNFFTAASMMITIPSAILIFSWIVTLWRGAVTVETPLLFCLGFLVLFILGGITGVMVASVPFDWQVHDTFFVVAHFHYVLVGGVVFPIFAALAFWFPKMTGRLLDETMGRVSFWTMFAGFNALFFPMHILGFQGMPRRIYTYLPEMGWDGLNLLATAGGFLMALGVLVFFVNALASLFGGRLAPANPWGAGTLEWAIASPPPPYNFERPPIVESLYPLWDGSAPLAWHPAPALAWREALTGTAGDLRETPATTPLDATPDHRLLLPGPTVWPLWTAMALSLAVAGAMIHPWVLVLSGGLAAAALVRWLWPGRRRPAERAAVAADERLPSTPPWRSTVWAGVALLVLIEATAVSSMIVAYFYLRMGHDTWPPQGAGLPGLLLPAIAVGVLVASVLPIRALERGLRANPGGALTHALPVGIALAAAYLVLRALEYRDVPYSWTTDAYGSLVWTITGYQSLHVIAVVVMAGVLWAVLRRNRRGPAVLAAVEGVGLYWRFVAVSSAFVFVAQNVSPYLL